MANGGAVQRGRLIAIAVFMAFWGLAIGGRLFFLQVVRSGELTALGASQRETLSDVSGRRGEIYDRNGNPLAISREVDSLYAVPDRVEDPASTAAFLSEVLETPASRLEELLTSDRSWVYLKRKITTAQSERIGDAAIQGLGFEKEPKRFYPNDGLAAHVLGFVNVDDDGGSGLEYEYNEIIRGAPPRVVLRTDGRGHSFEGLERAPKAGASLTTTIDKNIQYFVEQEITRTVRETGAVGMSVVVMDPTSGEVLAMANSPSFNPNEYVRFSEEAWRNRAVAHAFEPGSTFKIVTLAAALEEGLTHLGEVVDGQQGSIVLYGHRIHDHKAFGLLTVREVMQYSSDVGIIKIGLRLGDELFADYIDRLGFGRRTGVDLPGEHPGLTKPASDWSPVSVGAISMGQEIGATALQIVDLVSMVANGGTFYRPFVVKGITDPVTGLTRQIEPSGQVVLARSTARFLQEALEVAVSDGTATAAQIPGYSVAGKTGTAQKIDPDTGSYSATAHVASFAGYAPARDPEVAVVVVIDEPQGARYHGGDIAAPVFRRIVEQVLRDRSVPPDVPERLPPFAAADDPGGVTLRPVVLESVPEPLAEGGVDAGIRVRVPDFLGRPLRQVTLDCLTQDVKCVSSGSGVAIDQRPAPGDWMRPGTAVLIYFSTETGRVSLN